VVLKPISSGDYSNVKINNNEKKRHIILLKLRNRPFYFASLVFIIFLVIGGVSYFLTVPELFHSSPTCKVEGAVQNPYTYDPAEFNDEQVEITTNLVGSYKSEGENVYKGVPLYIIINHSQPKTNISKINVIGSDNYRITFDWADVENNDMMILIQEDNTLRLIAGNFDLTSCVRKVARIVIE